MSRSQSLILFLVALVAPMGCSVPVPLYAPEDDAPAAEASPGGKGFVSAQARPRAPVSLSASDGSGLALTSMNATAMVEDPVALTELELEFANPRDETIEGKFELVLPVGADISRFAMRIGGRWQEGEVVERQKARVAYESALYERRDPALLEQARGNSFSARVFPIAPHAKVGIRVSYVQTFADPARPYRLALAGLQVAERLDARVGVVQPGSGEVEWQQQHARRGVPVADLVVDRKARAAAAWRVGQHVVARVAVPGSAESRPPASMTVLMDTSASRAADFAAKVQQMVALIGALSDQVDAAAPLVVRAFDQTVPAPIYEGPIAGFDAQAATATLVERRALGATNVVRALGAAAANASERVLLLTDGMITAGPRASERLRRSTSAMATAGVQRLDVVAGSGLRDDDAMQALVSEGLAHAGLIIDGDRAPADVATQILRATAPPLSVSVDSAARTWPDRVRGVASGDGVLVFAELPESVSTLSVTTTPEGQPAATIRIPIETRDDPLITQAWVRADVERRLGDTTARDALTALSVEHRIVNELTALVVLETEEDYARFDIDRKGTRDVLTVDGDAVVARDPEVVVPGRVVTVEEFSNLPVGSSTSRDFTAVVESSAAASVDAVGVRLGGATSAESGYAHGGVRGYGPRTAAVTLRRTRVEGSLRRAAARRIGRRGLGGIQACFERSHDASVGGTLTVRLTTDLEGRVTAVDRLRGSLTASPGLRRCLDETMREWAYGRSGVVTHTFVFVGGVVPDSASDLEGSRDDSDPRAQTLAAIRHKITRGELTDAAHDARAWHEAAPADLLALLAVGEVAQAQGRRHQAARAYASFAELHPAQAPMLRFAAARLEPLGSGALSLAIDLLQEAQRQRPDHPSSHRALGWALARAERYEAAFDALAAGYTQAYPESRFESATAELGDELGVIAAAWIHARPKAAPQVTKALAKLGLSLASGPSLRFVLTWETDANDVDLHIRDRVGDHAYYSSPTLASGGSLLADVTNGFGPESFVIDGVARAAPYDVAVHYYARGPMGYGMGHVQVVAHDGHGVVEITNLPFVAVSEQQMVELGRVAAATASVRTLGRSR